MKFWQKKGAKLCREIEEFTTGQDYVLDQKLVEFDAMARVFCVICVCL